MPPLNQSADGPSQEGTGGSAGTPTPAVAELCARLRSLNVTSTRNAAAMLEAQGRKIAELWAENGKANDALDASAEDRRLMSRALAERDAEIERLWQCVGTAAERELEQARWDLGQTRADLLIARRDWNQACKLLDSAATDWEQAEERAERAKAELAERDALLELREGEIGSLALHISDLQAELAAARKDAERYRWLRDEHSDLSFMFALVKGRPLGIMARDKLDAAIDAAQAHGERREE